jgi:hypothetical protein
VTVQAATVAAYARRGYNRAAVRLGRTCAVYRPSGTGNPLASVLLTTLAAFDTVPGFTFANPQKFGQTTYYAMIDATGLQAGDYLVCQGVTYFAATVDDFGPPMVQRCDAVLTVRRATSVAGEYSGDVRSQETTLLTGWPAALVRRGAGGDGPAGLPTDGAMGTWECLLPSSVPVQLRTSDIIEDAQSQPMRYIIGAVEKSLLGLRIAARQAVA